MYLSLLHMLGSAIIRRLVPWLVRRNSILACAGILDRRDLVDPATATALIALPPGYSLSPERRLVACYLRYMEPWCVGAWRFRLEAFGLGLWAWGLALGAWRLGLAVESCSSVPRRGFGG